MPSSGIPKRDDTVFIMIDIQEKFLPVIYDIQSVIENSNRLVKSSSILNIPLIITEQYPKGLGPTVDEIQLEDNQSVIEKITFDCFGCDEFVSALDSLNRKCLIIFGIEAHVCILQTCLHAVEKGYEVHVIADAVSSRTQNNRNIALERIRQSGVFVASTEMILFQLLDRAGTDEFKAISKLVK
jgi:nicotinamidase-related amidase